MLDNIDFPFSMDKDPNSMAKQLRAEESIVLFVISGLNDDIPHSERYEKNLNDLSVSNDFHKMLYPISSDGRLFVDPECSSQKKRLLEFIVKWNDDMLGSVN